MLKRDKKRLVTPTRKRVKREKHSSPLESAIDQLINQMLWVESENPPFKTAEENHMAFLNSTVKVDNELILLHGEERACQLMAILYRNLKDFLEAAMKHLKGEKTFLKLSESSRRDPQNVAARLLMNGQKAIAMEYCWKEMSEWKKQVLISDKLKKSIS